MTALLVVAIALTTLATGVAVAVRAAAAVASQDRLAELADDGRAGAQLALRQLDDGAVSPAVVAQVAVPIGSVAIGWLAAALVRDGAGGVRPVAAVATGVVVAVCAALLCESLPRAAAAAAPERVLAALGWTLRPLVVLSAPVVAVTSRLAAAALYPVGMWLAGERGHAHTADELAEMASEIEGADGAGAGGLFAGALGFLDVRVAEVMARRDRIVTVPYTSTVEEAEQLVHRSGHSRVLVVGDRGEVTGFLHAKDLIGLSPSQRGGLLPAGLVRVALRVGPDDRVDDVLPRMRRARRHVAVVEEAGEVLGLVTLEDVLEAIVGDIRDESDQNHGPDDPRNGSATGDSEGDPS